MFRNGDENFRGVKVLLTQRTLYSMDHVRIKEPVMCITNILGAGVSDGEG